MLACGIGQSDGGAQVRVEIAVALKDVEFVGRALLVLPIRQQETIFKEPVYPRPRRKATLESP